MKPDLHYYATVIVRTNVTEISNQFIWQYIICTTHISECSTFLFRKTAFLLQETMEIV